MDDEWIFVARVTFLYEATDYWPEAALPQRQISRVKRDGPKSISLTAAISITLPIANAAEAIEVS